MTISGEQKITIPQKVTENYQQLSLCKVTEVTIWFK